MDEQSNSNESSVIFTAKQVKALVSGIVAAGILLGGLGGTGVLRIDKFGRSDFEEYVKKTLIPSIDLKCRIMEHEIRRDMPPAATKARIRAIERCLERNCTDFESATSSWQ